MRTLIILSFLIITTAAKAQVAGWFTNTESATGNSEPATFYDQLMISSNVSPWRIKSLSVDPSGNAVDSAKSDLGVYAPNGIYIKDDAGSSANWSQLLSKKELEKYLLLNGSFENSTITDWTSTGSTNSLETLFIVQGEGKTSVEISPTAAWDFEQDLNCDSYVGNTVGFEGWIKSQQVADICFISNDVEKSCVSYPGDNTWKKVLVKGIPVLTEFCGVKISSSTFTDPVFLDGFKFTTDTQQIGNTTDEQSLNFAGLGSSMTSISAGVLRWGTITDSGENYLTYDDSNGRFTANRDLEVKVSFSSRSASINFSRIRLNGSDKAGDTGAANAYGSSAFVIEMAAGDYIELYTGAALASGVNQYFSMTATVHDEVTITPADQFSTEETALTFKSTAVDCDTDPVGTYNTYAYTTNSSNANVLCGSAPTTTPSLESGFFLTAKTYATASACTTPNKYVICIGKNFRGTKFDAYVSTGKVNPVHTDFSTPLDTRENGPIWGYEASTGEFVIDNGINTQGATTLSRNVGQDLTFTLRTAAYVHVHASKDPLLATNGHKKCIVKYATAQNTSGGSCTAAAWTDYPLSEVAGDCSFLSFNDTNDELTMSQGEYLVTGQAQFHQSGSAKMRIRNNTQSTDMGSRSTTVRANSANNVGYAHFESVFTVANKDVLNFQYYVASNPGARCRGWETNQPGEEVYGLFTIEKLK